MSDLFARALLEDYTDMFLQTRVQSKQHNTKKNYVRFGMCVLLGKWAGEVGGYP